MSNDSDVVEQYHSEQQAAKRLGLILELRHGGFTIGKRSVAAVQWEFRLMYGSIDSVSAFIEGYMRAKGQSHG